MAKFIVVIPARRASTRLPDKPLADIAGKPMVVRVAERAAASGAVRLLVATDDAAIERTCVKHGVEAMMTRADHPSGTDRLAEVVERLALPDDTLIVNVQGDEPLIPPGLIAECAQTLALHPGCAIATASHRITDPADLFNPNVVKVVADAGGRALYFSRAPIPWARDAYGNSLADASTRPQQVIAAQRHIGLYAYRAGFLRRYPQLSQSPIEQIEALEQLRALWHGYRIAIFEAQETPAAGVDTPEDLERVRRAWTQ